MTMGQFIGLSVLTVVIGWSLFQIAAGGGKE